MSTVVEAPGDLRRDQEQLYCERGEHFWIRRRVRGTKPAHCPGHPPPRPSRAKSPEPRPVEQYSGTGGLLDPVLREMSGAAIASHTKGPREVAAALRRLAAVAEITALRLDP
jgi:hypothetical protein